MPTGIVSIGVELVMINGEEKVVPGPYESDDGHRLNDAPVHRDINVKQNSEIPGPVDDRGIAEIYGDLVKEPLKIF